MKTATKPKRAEGKPADTDRESELPRYVLRLYVTGMSRRSTQAVLNIQKICEEYLHGRYELEVVDLYQKPVLAAGEQIIAAPTLIKKLPLPLRRFIGDMTNVDRIVVGLDLIPKGTEPATRSKE